MKANKYLLYLLCVLLVISGVYASVSLYKIQTTTIDTSLVHVIYGYAFYEDGNPATGATVDIENLDTGESVPNVDTVASDGFFSFTLGYPGPDWGNGERVKVTITQGGTETYQGWSGSGTVTIDTSIEPQKMDNITLHPPSPPNTPSQPSGPTEGEIGVSYTYSTSTTDPNNIDVKYGWDWNGDGTVDEWTTWYTSGDTCSISHSWATKGSYNVQVKAMNKGSQESSFSTPLTVYIGMHPPNTPSTPSGATTGYHCNSYTYSTSTTDPDGDDVYYLFDWGDGTNSGWIGPYSSGSSASADHTWSEPGTYEVKVKAKDTDDMESDWSSSLTVTMDNHPPGNPNQPTGPTSGYHGTTYTYSTDPVTDADPCDTVKYLFDWGDGTTSQWLTTPSADHTWSEPGTYEVKVKASDGYDESDWSSSLTVTMDNRAPDTPDRPSSDTTTFYAGIDYTFHTSTTDPDGDNIYYKFDWGDGTNSGWIGPYRSGRTGSATHRWSEEGDYEVRVKAKDEFDLESDWSQILTIHVNPGERFYVDGNGPYYGEVNRPIQFHAEAYNGVEPIEWLWKFGDGATSNEQNPTHIYTEVGTYNITLYGRDSEGNEDYYFTYAIISPHINHAPAKPTISTDYKPPQGKFGKSYEFRASTTDPDGDNIYFKFDWGDGNSTGWLGPYDNLTEAVTNYAWHSDTPWNKETFTVTVVAKDDPNGDGNLSDGSESEPAQIQVAMPKTPSHLLLEFIKNIITTFFENHPFSKWPSGLIAIYMSTISKNNNKIWGKL